MTLLFDSESNGLLPELDRIHCLCLMKPGDASVRRYHDQPGLAPRDGSLAMALEELELADEIAAHNLIGFDLPALRKVYPGWNPRGRLRDTLIIARTIWPEQHQADLDATNVKRGREFPKKFIGRHSLAAWGHRLKDLKGESPTSWTHLTPEMLDYCAQDVVVLELLWRRIQAHQPTDAQIELEQAFAPIIEAMTKRGYLLDVAKVEALVAQLQGRRVELTAAIRAAFPDFVEEYVTPKRQQRKTRTIEFNPNSRAHVARGLTEKYGWKPKAYTPTGQPQVDEAVMAALPYPEAKIIHERLVVQKRLGTLAEGESAWLKLVGKDGRVRGRVQHNACVTSRCAHSRPNLGNIETGPEMRSCWVAGPGKVLVIVDASALEARIIGHYAARFDGGELAQVLLEGDVHARNMELVRPLLGGWSPPRSGNGSIKNAFYAILYGAQDRKVGLTVGKGEREGKIIRDAILAGLPGLGKLIRAVTADAGANGWLRLPDGRRAWVRAKHAALNTLVQGTGAILMKKAIVHADNRWIAHWGAEVDMPLVAFVHDELVVEVSEADSEWAGPVIADSIMKAGEFYKLRVPLAAHVAIGRDWSAK